MNLVIFAGAGFSAVAGLPVMANFSDRIRDSGALGGDERHDFDQIQRECDVLGSFIGGSARNVEQLMSFVSVLDMTLPDYRFVDCKVCKTPRDALFLVTSAIGRLVAAKLPVEQCQWCKRLIDLHTGGLANLSFVTTNYDRLIEFSCL